MMDSGKDAPLTHDIEQDPWFQIIQEAILLGKEPQSWPEPGLTGAGWQGLAKDIIAVRAFMLELDQADLSAEVKVKGQLAGNIKAFQNKMHHLAWQVQQVAAGDLTQKVEFMGDFSNAFNQVIANLENAQSELQSSEARYRLLAETLRDSAAALNSALGLDNVLNVLLAKIDQVVPHDTMEILMIDSHGIAHVSATKGYEIDSSDLNQHVFQINLPVMQIPNLAQMATNGKPLLIDDLNEYAWIRKESNQWANSHLGAPILVKGKPVGFIILLSSITGFFETKYIERLEIFADLAAVAIEKARLFEQLNEMVTTDSLTTISNRRHFFNMAENELTRSIRYHHPLSALMMDIDHFKQVNDTYGHSNGDQVLHALAQRCIKTLRTNDLIGRYGGEEFSFILPETSIEEAVNVAERLREIVAKKPFTIQNGNIHITVSIGVAGFQTQMPSARALLDLADQALDQAKRAGRNRVAKA